MIFLKDEYRNGWALRFLKEAKIELFKAEEAPIPNMSSSFALISMKKAQTAIYYSLGDPEYLAFAVKEALQEKGRNKDLLMVLLTQIERFINNTSSEIVDILRKDIVIIEAKKLLEIASDIIALMVERNIKCE